MYMESKHKNRDEKKSQAYRSILVSVKNADKGDKKPFECDLHLNLWKRKKDSYMLDFGLMLYDIVFSEDEAKRHTFKSILLYLPYKCVKDDISDLGSLLNGNNDFVSTLFNVSYEQSSGPNKSSMRHYQNIDATPNSFYIYALGDNDINCINEQSSIGSFVEISVSIPETLKSEKFNLYIRFRISINSDDGVSFLKHDEHISNNVLQAAFSRMELYDCRFNDIRDTDDKIFQQLTDKSRLDCTLVLMRKVHFFFMTDAKDQISNGNMDRMDTRMLENYKWKDYIGESIKHAYVAYHWKRNGDSKDNVVSTFPSFEVFFRDTCNNNNVSLISAYLMLVVSLGTTGSLLSTVDFSAPINWTAIIINIISYLLFIILKFI